MFGESFNGPEMRDHVLCFSMNSTLLRHVEEIIGLLVGREPHLGHPVGLVGRAVVLEKLWLLEHVQLEAVIAPEEVRVALVYADGENSLG